MTLSSVQKGTISQEFKEAEEMRAIIASLVHIYKDDIAVETAYERCQVIIDQYLAQPHVLDPHLESLLGQLLDIVRDVESPVEVVHLAFKLMYLITKTRGHKVIVRLMPHEVADLEPVLALLDLQDKGDFKTWETRYMLLLWLSIVSMIPFDMVRLDSNVHSLTGEKRRPIMERIIDAGKHYLDVSDKSRDAAAYMLSRFTTRPDVKKEKLPEFLDWGLKKLQAAELQTMSSQFVATGILSTLALLFKHGKREDLIPYAPIILEQITKLEIYKCKNDVLQKLGMKLVQRLGLTFLKAKVATWRYQRGSRSLANNLLIDTPKLQTAPAQTPNEQHEEEYDIPEQIEDVIEQLLNGLKNRVTVVRWSAAKGVGRITGRLPEELADEVVGSIMEVFTISETDAAWHGGCLALAELGRRGLLLPGRLPDVVPVILKALAYDEKRGNFSVGAHVRDAACYVCWAFARAYEPQDLEPYVHQIANALVIVAVFDREVNVRRAAAAAFQENVGRQGQFPHGIDILTTCDYFAVGNINNCYLELSMFLAQFPEYTSALIDHLATVKVSHWDIAIRDLAAEGMYRLTGKAPTQVTENVLPVILANCSSMDLNLRHGSLIMVAYVVLGLADTAVAKQRNVADVIGPKFTEELRCLIQKLHEAKLFRGEGGELMRKAVCCVIEKLSLARMPFHDDPVIDVWQDMIDDCIMYPEPEIPKAASIAIPAFVSQYYQKSDGTTKPKVQEIITKYLNGLESTVETTRMGCALALGHMPRFVLRGQLNKVLDSLLATSRVSDTNKLVEARRDAILALTSVCVTVGVQSDKPQTQILCRENVALIYEALFNGMTDYTVDHRGDVGALVREASMAGLRTVTSLLAHQDISLITENMIERIFCCLVQQSCEKIERTRARAGEVFHMLLYHKPEIPYIPHRDDLLRIFPQEEEEGIFNWAVPSATFPRFTELLSYPVYSYYIVLGLTVSVGGLTESLVHYSSASLMNYLSQHLTDSAAINAFGTQVLKISSNYRHQNLVMCPLLKMLDQLLSNGCFDVLAADSDPSFAVELREHCAAEIKRSSNPQKLLTAVDVFCGLLQFHGQIRKKTLSQLLIFLCHKFPRVRKGVASKLYEAMITFDGIVEEGQLDEVMEILSDTQWDEPVDSIRPIRNKLCDLLGVPTPVLKKESGPVVT